MFGPRFFRSYGTYNRHKMKKFGTVLITGTVLIIVWNFQFEIVRYLYFWLLNKKDTDHG